MGQLPLTVRPFWAGCSFREHVEARCCGVHEHRGIGVARSLAVRTEPGATRGAHRFAAELSLLVFGESRNGWWRLGACDGGPGRLPGRGRVRATARRSGRRRRTRLLARTAGRAGRLTLIPGPSARGELFQELCQRGCLTDGVGPVLCGDVEQGQRRRSWRKS